MAPTDMGSDDRMRDFAATGMIRGLRVCTFATPGKIQHPTCI
jgi:hypothetical protein